MNKLILRSTIEHRLKKEAQQNQQRDRTPTPTDQGNREGQQEASNEHKAGQPEQVPVNKVKREKPEEEQKDNQREGAKEGQKDNQREGAKGEQGGNAPADNQGWQVTIEKPHGDQAQQNAVDDAFRIGEHPAKAYLRRRLAAGDLPEDAFRYLSPQKLSFLQSMYPAFEQYHEMLYAIRMNPALTRGQRATLIGRLNESYAAFAARAFDRVIDRLEDDYKSAQLYNYITGLYGINGSSYLAGFGVSPIRAAYSAMKFNEIDAAIKANGQPTYYLDDKRDPDYIWWVNAEALRSARMWFRDNVTPDERTIRRWIYSYHAVMQYAANTGKLTYIPDFYVDNKTLQTIVTMAQNSNAKDIRETANMVLKERKRVVEKLQNNIVSEVIDANAAYELISKLEAKREKEGLNDDEKTLLKNTWIGLMQSVAALDALDPQLLGYLDNNLRFRLHKIVENQTGEKDILLTLVTGAPEEIREPLKNAINRLSDPLEAQPPANPYIERVKQAIVNIANVYKQYQEVAKTKDPLQIASFWNNAIKEKNILQDLRIAAPYLGSIAIKGFDYNPSETYGFATAFLMRIASGEVSQELSLLSAEAQRAAWPNAQDIQSAVNELKTHFDDIKQIFLTSVSKRRSDTDVNRNFRDWYILRPQQGVPNIAFGDLFINAPNVKLEDYEFQTISSMTTGLPSSMPPPYNFPYTFAPPQGPRKPESARPSFVPPPKFPLRFEPLPPPPTEEKQPANPPVPPNNPANPPVPPNNPVNPPGSSTNFGDVIRIRI